MWKLSVPSAQSGYKPNIILKNKVYKIFLKYVLSSFTSVQAETLKISNDSFKTIQLVIYCSSKVSTGPF